MKTLILSDETFGLMKTVLAMSEDGREVLRRFDARPMLPDDRDLVALSRDKDAAPPTAITLARMQRDAGIQAAEDTRLAMNDLVRHCHGAGIRPTVLARWFGLSPTRVYEILGPLQISEG